LNVELKEIGTLQETTREEEKSNDNFTCGHSSFKGQGSARVN